MFQSRSVMFLRKRESVLKSKVRVASGTTSQWLQCQSNLKNTYLQVLLDQRLRGAFNYRLYS